MKNNILLVEPPKSKKYHTRYPPLGLLKLAAYHKSLGDKVSFVKGYSSNGYVPNIIYITSLFTYAYEPVHDVIKYYRRMFKKAEIIVGGIYATLCAEHLTDIFKTDSINIHRGLLPQVDDLLPDYSLVPEWSSSIIFSSRGCIRNCHFCSVPKLEPLFTAKDTIKHLVYPGHKKIIFWDNNILASPHWPNIFSELEACKLEVDFNQGIDARLITEHIATQICRLKLPIIRLAYDSRQIRNSIRKAISLLKERGVRGRRIIVYCLYNTEYDKPEDFLERIKDIIEWGAVAYPMRYEPIEPRPKNSYISPKWTQKHLEMIADARRVIGYGGSFPPYDGLKKKILCSNNFSEAFSLRPIITQRD